MRKETITFQLDTEKLTALDALAASLNRDRAYVLKQAIDAYLDVQKWQMEHIEASIRRANAGDFVEHDAIRKQAAKWRAGH
jgi:predicted transcriptional regulator